MSDTKPLTRDEIGAAIAEKAWTDEAFHREVLADPGAAYEKYLGQPLPAGLTIKVVEDTPGTVHFVIPAKPSGGGELSDSELEHVAGGVTPLSVASVLGSLAALSVGVGANTGRNAGW